MSDEEMIRREMEMWLAPAEDEDRCWALMCNKAEAPLMVFDFPTGGPCLDEASLMIIMKAAGDKYLELLKAETEANGGSLEVTQIDTGAQ